MALDKATSRTRAQAQTKEALLDAARKLVAERGFGGASIGEIVAEAGFTKGAFYSNFASREAMLLELLLRVRADQRATFDVLGEGVPKKLSTAIEHLVELVVRHADNATTLLLLAEVQLQAQRNHDFFDIIQKGFDQQMIAFAGWIDELKTEHRLKTNMSSTAIARTIMALSQGYAQQPGDKSQIRVMMTHVLESLLC